MTEMHYIITTQQPTPTGAAVRTQEGTVNVAPGDTRQEIYLRIYDNLNLNGPATTLFFALERNAIG